MVVSHVVLPCRLARVASVAPNLSHAMGEISPIHRDACICLLWEACSWHDHSLVSAAGIRQSSMRTGHSLRGVRHTARSELERRAAAPPAAWGGASPLVFLPLGGERAHLSFWAREGRKNTLLLLK